MGEENEEIQGEKPTVPKSDASAIKEDVRIFKEGEVVPEDPEAWLAELTKRIGELSPADYERLMEKVKKTRESGGVGSNVDEE